jgi:hypothetical protein
VRAHLGLIAAAAVAVWICAAATALGYGTDTTYASQSAGTPPGAWAGVAGAGSASDSDASATLTETDAATVAASQYPTNRAFSGNATGWTTSDNSAVLCSVSTAYDNADGNPSGSLRTTYSVLLNLGGLLGTCSSSWTSNSFTWSSGTPASVAFAMDRAVDLNGLASGVSVTWTAVLVDETVAGSKTLVTETRGTDGAWATQTATGLSASDVLSGHTYHLRIDISFQSTRSLVNGMGFNADNITLTVTPRDYQADGELRVLSVPKGTTHTLELRARTSGETFNAQVWNGAGWTTRGTVTAVSPSWGLISYGLTSAEWNSGTVRVRFLASGSGADGTADVLSVEYLRVVSTGGITISGPTSVSLPVVTIDGVSSRSSSGSLGQVEVVDSGGSASGWSVHATATRWALDGSPGQQLPATAFTGAPTAPTTPDGSDLTGVAGGAGGTFDTSVPITLMTASSGHGVGTYRENPGLSLVVPVTALQGIYRCVITLSVS